MRPSVEARRPRARHRHAAARSRRVSTADGARLAWIFRSADTPDAENGRVYEHHHPRAADRSGRQRSCVVCGGRHEERTKNEERITKNGNEEQGTTNGTTNEESKCLLQ